MRDRKLRPVDERAVKRDQRYALETLALAIISGTAVGVVMLPFLIIVWRWVHGALGHG